MIESAISLPFRFYSGGVAYTTSKPEVWKDRVFIAITTGLNERVMLPTYGTELKRAVFESYQDAAEASKKTIGMAFSTWLPTLTLDEIRVEPDQGDGTLNITVNYTLPNAQKDVLIFKTNTFNRYGEIVRRTV